MSHEGQRVGMMLRMLLLCNVNMEYGQQGLSKLMSDKTVQTAKAQTVNSVQQLQSLDEQLKSLKQTTGAQRKQNPLLPLIMVVRSLS